MRISNIFSVLFAVALCFPLAYGQTVDYEILKDLSPTHNEKVFRNLELVRTIPFEFGTDKSNKDDFLVFPSSITADEQGNIYVFDSRRTKCFAFNRRGKFLFRFSGRGEGPGEVKSHSFGMGAFPVRKINYSPHHGILICGYANKWIAVFDKSGKLKKEIPIPLSRDFYPVIDPSENVYMLSVNDGAVDVFDKDQSLKHTLLTGKDLRRFFDFKPLRPWFINVLSRVEDASVFYDWLPGNRFVIFLKNSSSVYLFKNFKLTDHYSIRPKQALKVREKKITNSREIDNSKEWQAVLKKYPKAKTNYFEYHAIFNEFLLDKDDREHYYLTLPRPRPTKKWSLYKFAISGELVEVLDYPLGKKGEYCHIREKRNGLFYGLGDKIYIYKKR